MPGRGYELIYANYFASLERSTRVAHMGRSSFCEARDKLSWEAFAYLLNKSSLENRSEFEMERWLGHRVRAVDGTNVQLPCSEEILATFPRRRSLVGEVHYPQLHLTVAADVFTCQPTHSIVHDKHFSERDDLLDFLKTFDKGDVALLDRGFDGKRVWQSFDDVGQHYVARIRARGACVLSFNPSKKDQTIETKNESGKIMKIRIIRGNRFRNGDYLFLATNLLDAKKYERTAVLDLYKRRQAVEDVFLNLKNTLHAKNIRSKKVNGVLQEVYAALTMTSIVAGIRYLFEHTIKRRRINYKAITWRIETAIEVLVRPLSRARLNRIFHGICSFQHLQQPDRMYPRWSLQPEQKWIKERRKVTYRAKKRKIQN
jgi:hypothetical protein